MSLSLSLRSDPSDSVLFVVSRSPAKVRSSNLNNKFEQNFSCVCVFYAEVKLLKIQLALKTALNTFLKNIFFAKNFRSLSDATTSNEFITTNCIIDYDIIEWLFTLINDHIRCSKIIRDVRTDVPTDGPTDGARERTSYRDA